MATQPAAPAAPTGVALPSFTVVARPPVNGKTKEPNPYEDFMKTLATDVKGFSEGILANHASDAVANVHKNMIRRAAKSLGLGVSVIIKDAEKGTKDLTFAVVPKRVRNTDTGKIEAPAQGAPDPA